MESPGKLSDYFSLHDQKVFAGGKKKEVEDSADKELQKCDRVE